MQKKTKIKKEERKWYLLDASNVRLGKLAAFAAKILIGKNKVKTYPNIAIGDNLIIINCEKISVFPRKLKTKKYYRHSGYMGSLKEETLEDFLARKPEGVILEAIKGMLPGNKLKSVMLKRLYIYKGSIHGHDAQKPTRIDIKSK